MDKEKAQFLPFHAINEFMLPEYRLQVLQTVLGNIDHLSPERRNAINQLLKRSLKVPGFRNVLQAPVAIKVKNSVTTFERSPEMVAQVVSGWTELHPDLRTQVFDLLTGLGWELLPVEADRTHLPGFLTRWPKTNSFEVITAAFHEKYPDAAAADNDISLMTVWLGGRLPYDVVESSETE